MQSLLKQIPNILTFSRFLCAALFPLVSYKFQIIIFFYAGFSELLDGFFARLLNAETPLGKLLDPIADKTFILTVIVTFMYEGIFHVYHLLLLGFRDLTIITAALVVLASKNRENFHDMAPEWFGKIQTAGQFAILYFVLMYRHVHTGLFIFVSVCSVLSALYYTKVFFKKNLHLANGETLTPTMNRSRKAEMGVLVATLMVFGLIIATYSYLYTQALAR